MQHDHPLREESGASFRMRELERLRREATASLDRMLAALIEAVHLAPVIPTSETTHCRFFTGLMIEIFKDDLRLGLSVEDAGWGTIHRFHRHCNKVYPGWASKQTFYQRMDASLDYLLERGIVQKRQIKRRLGMGRAKYEYRVNPDNPEIKDLLKSRASLVGNLSLCGKNRLPKC